MTAAMRPMSLGEILDRTIQIYRSKFLVFVGLAAFPALAIMALRLAGFLWETFGPRLTLSARAMAALQDLSSWLTIWQLESFAYCLACPAFAYVASRAFLGEEPTLLSAVFWCAARWRSCLALVAVLWVGWNLLPSVLNGTLLTAHLASSWIAPLLGHSFATISVFIFLARWVVDSLASLALSPTIPVWTVEALPVPRAVRRGWALATGSRFRILAAWSLATGLRWVLYFTLSGVSLLVLRFALQFSSRWDWFYMIYRGIFSMSVQAAFILAAPLYPIAVTLIYYDQRIRLEGYDIERMMQAAGMDAPVTPPAGDRPVAPVEAGEAQG